MLFMKDNKMCLRSFKLYYFLAAFLFFFSFRLQPVQHITSEDDISFFPTRQNQKTPSTWILNLFFSLSWTPLETLLSDSCVSLITNDFVVSLYSWLCSDT